jgi:hypothetical protein
MERKYGHGGELLTAKQLLDFRADINPVGSSGDTIRTIQVMRTASMICVLLFYDLFIVCTLHFLIDK